MTDINLKTGFLKEVKILKSPFIRKRDPAQEVSLIVIHGISLPPGEFGGRHIDDLFLGRLNPNDDPYFETIAGLAVSAHLLIDRLGAITQYVSFYDQAMHAGQSEFLGKPRCNEFSIGIELEGVDNIPYEVVQYRQLALVIRDLMQLFPKINLERIVGHSEISPGRKTDPGPAFDWELLRWNLLQS